MSEEYSDDTKYSSKVHLSYSLGSFFDQFFVSSFTVRVIYFYENELFLSIILIGIAFIIYGFWNMINDPIIGWISDKGTRFTKRWGRRFPWFMIGALTINIVYIFVYIVPFGDQLGMFIWLLVIICIYELCYSLWQVSWLSLFPDKFRSQKERTKLGALTMIFMQLGIVLGIIIPPLFIIYGNVQSYIRAAIIVSIIGFVIVLFLIPGMKEDEELIMHELKSIEKQKIEKESYFQIVKFTMKQKNFVSYVLFYLALYMLPLLMLASLPFWTIYIIKTKNPMFEIMIAGSFILGGLISAPFWLKLGRKFGNRKCFIYASLAAIIAFVPLIFVSDLTLTIIGFLTVGFCVGGLLTLLYPGFSEVIDELVVKTGKRREGAYTGIRTFVGRTSFVIQAIIFAVVHTATNYVPGAETQTPLALWGIRVIMVVIPMICCFICFVFIYFFYDLTPEQVNLNRAQLKKIGL
ncbi:MAG: MFS transporter [Promethearchaeota archaeon]|nr:MAG: MFS transporter [Candidatus Lokiarchaeota archaeon]